MWMLRLNKVVHEFKVGGLPAVARHVGQRLVRRNAFLVFVTDLRTPQPAYACPEGYTLRLLPSDEEAVDRLVAFWLASYAENYPLFYNEQLVRQLLEARFAAEELCFVAEHGNAIAHFHWVSRFGRCQYNQEEPLKFLPFRPGIDAYGYNVFTHPEHRSKGLALATLSFLFDWLRQHGHERFLTCVGTRNAASIKTHAKVSTHVSTLYVTRYLVFDRARLMRAPGS